MSSGRLSRTGVRLYTTRAWPIPGRYSRGGLESSDGKCLGLVLADFDGDGWPHIFVANDSVMNFLYHNQRWQIFESGLASGVGS